MSSNGIKAVVEQLQPACEMAVGHPFKIDFSTAASLKQKIEAGEAFDVAVLPPANIDDLIKSGKIAAPTRVDIARAGVGLGVRAGAKKPDISTPEAMKQTLLKAKSIIYQKDGASRVFIDKMMERLGIADAVKSKIVLSDVPGRPQESVAEGQSEIVLTLISEILPIHGVQYVGPLPGDLQNYVSFAAGASAHPGNAEAAKAAVKCLSGPKVGPVLKAKGMEALPTS
jgi:molybdate transport system substrate-binding protein